MKTLKVLSLISALTPVAYCAQMAFDLSDYVETAGTGRPGGWWQHALESGLAPAMIGLGAVGLVFVIAFVLKLLGVLRSGADGGARSRRRPEGSAAADEGADAEAMIARYLARNSHEPEPAGRARSLPSAPARSFGRRSA